MAFLNSIKERRPGYAKDIRLNLDGAIARSSLAPEDALGVALAAAVAARTGTGGHVQDGDSWRRGARGPHGRSVDGPEQLLLPVRRDGGR